MESAFGLTDANYAFQPSKPLLDVFVAAEGLPSVSFAASLVLVNFQA